jgi:2-dehydropantoate 2-reductase
VGAAKVVVLGAGSIGCFVGGAWQAAGIDVTFVGRPGIAGEIEAHGLTLSDYSGWRAGLSPSEVDYRCAPDVLAEADLIALCVKSGGTAEAAKEIARHARDGTTVISFQNGVSNVDMLEQALGRRFDIARGMVPYNVAALGQGRFHKGVGGDLWADRSEATARLSQAIGDRGPAILKLSDQMLELAWGKLLINLNNAVNALSGRSLIEELRERDYRRVFAASIGEGLTLLKQARIEPATIGSVSAAMLPRILRSPDWLFNHVFLKRWKIDDKARSSMADDLAAGRSTEVDYINGELVRLAERLNADAPVNRRIVELVRAAEQGAGPLAPDALRRAALA